MPSPTASIASSLASSLPPSRATAQAGQHVAADLVELVSFGPQSTVAGASQPMMNLTRLGNDLTEHWLTATPARVVQQGTFSGQQTDQFLWLQACVEVVDLGQVRELASRLYTELCGAVRALDMPRFVRIWNYIPQINHGVGDAETYRQFCWGRADGLTDVELPAATGIGSHDGWLRIGALSTAAVDDAPAVTHLENPRQLSAWRYPREYGPKSPSFARATLIEPAPAEVPATSHSALLLLSGTSSIVHHQTCHAGDLAKQTEETAKNIGALLAGLPRPAKPLAMRYYLRHASQLGAARAHWRHCFPDWAEPAYYHADICRADLDMEIEGVFSV